jgi:AcrR family transcriptional regulator
MHSMQREEKAERSRRQVLNAALELFSRQGYRGTSVREIAEMAGVSTGAVYHHFPGKEAILNSLIDEYLRATENPRFPFNRAISAGKFPENIEDLGYAARDSVREYARYLTLIYVDVIEFQGAHIRKVYPQFGSRFLAMLEQQGQLEEVRTRLRSGVSPKLALMLTARIFFNYFAIEILFGVREPFGIDSSQMIHEIADILRRGLLPS